MMRQEKTIHFVLLIFGSAGDGIEAQLNTLKLYVVGC